MSVGRRKKGKGRAPKVVLPSPLTGSFATAERGREAGRMFLIVGGSDADGRVYIADGKKRRLSEPKLKSVRHLTIHGVCGEARGLIPAGKYTDGDIRRAIRGAASNDDLPKGE